MDKSKEKMSSDCAEICKLKPDNSNLSDEFCNLLKEVRVRFVGFGAEEDEWVSIKKAVRERSIPLEHSECHMVNVGDLVLCFQVIIKKGPFCFRI